jgi:hypothetical protein
MSYCSFTLFTNAVNALRAALMPNPFKVTPAIQEVFDTSVGVMRNEHNLVTIYALMEEWTDEDSCGYDDIKQDTLGLFTHKSHAVDALVDMAVASSGRHMAKPDDGSLAPKGRSFLYIEERDLF